MTNVKEEAINMRKQGMEANRNAAKSLKDMLKSGKGLIVILLLSFCSNNN